MRKARRILCGSIVVVLALIALLLAYPDRVKPPIVWNGQPAQYWIGRLNFFDLEGASASAEEFLFSAGPEVVPELIRGLSLRGNWVADLRHALYFKIGKWQRFFKLPTKPAYYRVNCATGLGLIGPAASNATPALVRALRDKDPYLRAQAAEALGRIGSDKIHVVPELVAGLSSTNSKSRLGCIIGLCHCLPGSAEAATALRSALRDPDSNIRAWVADYLYRDDTNPGATFAALVNALQDTSATVRGGAAQSLGKMRHNPDQSAAALGAALEREVRSSANQVLNWNILASLGEIGVASKPVMHLLINQSIQTNDNYAATLSIIALGRIEPDNQDWIDQLTKRLDQDAFGAAWELGRRGKAAASALGPLRRLADTAADWRVQAMAATAAWRIDPSSPNPIYLITNQLPQGQNGRYEIVRLLGELGPAARPALPTLLQLRYCRGKMMHDYANDALKTVAPEYLANPWQK